MSLQLYPVDFAQEVRDNGTVRKYESAMLKREIVDENTKTVEFYPGFAFVVKRPIDAVIADGKRQRSFQNRNEYFGLQASVKSAAAQILARKPTESRSYEGADDI